jgi:hypothetical protein
MPSLVDFERIAQAPVASPGDPPECSYSPLFLVSGTAYPSRTVRQIISQSRRHVRSFSARCARVYNRSRGRNDASSRAMWFGFGYLLMASLHFGGSRQISRELRSTTRNKLEYRLGVAAKKHDDSMAQQNTTAARLLHERSAKYPILWASEAEEQRRLTGSSNLWHSVPGGSTSGTTGPAPLPYAECC